MKKIIFVIFALMVLSSVSFAQITRYLDFGTIVNDTQETLYLSLDDVGYTDIDSVAVGVLGTGRVALDSIAVYGGIMGKFGTTNLNGFITSAVNIVPTYTSTAAGTTTFAAGGIFSTNIAYYNALKVTIDPTHTGNTAADPNKCVLVFRIYGKK